MDVNKKSVSLKIIGFILIFSTLLLTYGFTMGIKGLKVKEYMVIDKKLPSSFYGFKIVHFTDLHYGRTIDKDNIDEVVNEINNLNGDIVVFTGDLLDRDTKLTSDIKNVLIENLSKIESKYGNYFVGGNHDKVNKGFYDIMENSYFINLENNTDVLYKDFNSISISGNKSNIDKVPNLKHLDDPKINDFKILLIHEPDNMKYIKDYNFNLVLAGHSHNGQVRIPIIGKLITPKGAKLYYDEYYKINNTNFYISSGIGTSVLNIRLFNKPSINLYRLVNK